MDQSECMQMSAALSVNEWQYDAFKLEEASSGRPLSCLAFFLFKRSDLISKFNLNETKLARFLMRIEEGYPNNPYHCRTHAADVLRSLHVVLNRGKVMAMVVAAAQTRALALQLSLADKKQEAAEKQQVRAVSVRAVSVWVVSVWAVSVWAVSVRVGSVRAGSMKQQVRMG